MPSIGRKTRFFYSVLYLSYCHFQCLSNAAVVSGRDSFPLSFECLSSTEKDSTYAQCLQLTASEPDLQLVSGPCRYSFRVAAHGASMEGTGKSLDRSIWGQSERLTGRLKVLAQEPDIANRKSNKNKTKRNQSYERMGDPHLTVIGLEKYSKSFKIEKAGLVKLRQLGCKNDKQI